ncbi:cation:proton antiporter [Methanocorpusculum vombati]|uniref:Cation:proton antiporter n=1 Tax=Methanocorpusculum vombati TaxID=3002864 RepID=A0ABT4INT6_9EURY|nr:cation:proton antiporter [Methanocorpusculum vombati]MCZ9319199.1 cation:proton antiporter [Methanocorpusculum sp.]MDE2520062.1 cation:proton antiporter [Methanocorpusculum sp.]MDE2534217.1 cation:proton antiporter [Methanocorpusculum sp.]MDE2545871.1 cation:proton antiporter [Methanocorpusculum sp.]
METEAELIMSVVVVLACAIAVLFVGRRLRMPFIIGYFITGIIVGPACLGLVTEEQVSLLAELGVILLMFTIGLEMSLKSLLSMKKIVLIGGTLQLVITTAAVWAVMVAVGFASNLALFIGFLVAHSSTAVIMNLYQNSGEIDTKHGKIALGLLIFQDLNVIPMMLMVPILAGSAEANFFGELLNFGVGMVVLVIVLVAAIFLVPRFLTRVALTRSKELFIISIVAICFGIAWLMSLNGVSLALGAFLAGIAISESDYSHEVIGQILPFRDLLTSFFFVSIGMMLNLVYVWEHLILIIAVAILLLLGKTLINFISVKAIGIASGAALLSAIGLSQVGEFSFILGSTGLEAGILSQDIYQVFLAITIVTMAVTPFAVNAGPALAKRLIKPKVPGENIFGNDIESCDVRPKEHVVIVGYGLAGQYVAKALKRVDIPYIILELNAETVDREKRRGERIVYGDATRDSILEYAGLMKARTIVISIPDMEAIKAIICTARGMNPRINIITRSRFISETEELYRLGADEVIVDEREAAIQIFRRILANEQVPQQDLDQYVKQIRNDLYDQYIDAKMTPNARETEGNGWFEAIRLKAKSIDEKTATSRSSVEQIHVGRNCEVAGKRLSDIHLRANYGVSVIAVRRGEEGGDTVVAPDGNTMLEEGDTAVVIGDRAAITEILPLFIENTEEKEE